MFRALGVVGTGVGDQHRVVRLASDTLLRWWWQEGGDAVSFGSDAHQPFRVWAHTSTWPWM